MYQLILKHLLLKANPNIEIEQYKNGAVALDEFERIKRGHGVLPDIVFLDINMPVIDGWQFLERIELVMPGLGAMVNIYMISTSLDARDKDKALANKNIKEYIYKPATMEQLEEIVA